MSIGRMQISIIEEDYINLLEQAKEMEKEQQDEFAIRFAEWLTYNRENNYTKSIKELLEIFKNK